MIYPENSIKEKGAIALLLAIIIISVVFTISVGMAIVRMVQIKFALNVSDSTISYQAADSGIEYALSKIQSDSTGSNIDGGSICPNEAEIGLGKYCLELDYAGDDVVSIRSIGKYRNTKRAVEIRLQE